MADGHCFISYSNRDAEEFGHKLAYELEGGTPYIDAWFDKRDILPGKKWDEVAPDAIKSCKCLIFAMTKDSIEDKSICSNELDLALRYKKPILILKLQNVEPPFRLADRQWIDFSNHKAGMARLRMAIARLDSPEGQLDLLKERFDDAKRDFNNAKSEEEKQRIQLDIDDLTKQIETQQKIVNNPQAAQEQTQANIAAGLERERQPQMPTVGIKSSKFINPPPGIAPNYFQDRTVETKQVFDFLKDDAQRLLTIVGRGGVGKTAMTCRLLKHLENSAIPEDVQKAFDNLQPLKVDGILYLSESGSHRVNFANIFYDLCKLLPKETAQELDAIYKNPQGSTESKMRALLEKFTSDPIVLLLDNFEPLVDTETFEIKDAELNEALLAFLNGTHTAVNIVITTRVAPKKLNLVQPGRQRPLDLDDGLESPYAENILRDMDSDGRMGLKSAPNELLNRARERTRGYPRALEALFAILASDRYTSLEELLAKPTPENVVQELVGEAFNRLDTNAQKVMQALAVYNRPVTPAAVDYLLAPHIPAIDSAPILQRLANMHFARKESGRFYLHPVDREFAYHLLPEGSSDDTFIEKGGLQLFGKLWNLLQKYPDLLQNQDTYNQAIQNENANIVIGSVMAFQNLDDSLVEKMQQEGFFQDENFLAELDKSFRIPPIWSRYALTNRAADYFAAARKPRAEWKKLDDLSAQLAEFDLRCAAGDYDTAASILEEVDVDNLYLWGHYFLVIQLHEKISKKIQDPDLRRRSIGNLGLGYKNVGKVREAIKNYETALSMAREENNRQAEGAWLNNIGAAYHHLGDSLKAIEFYEQALIINREVGDRRGEGASLSNLGEQYSRLGEDSKSIDFYYQALKNAREIGYRYGEGRRLSGIADVFIRTGDLENAIKHSQDAVRRGQEISSPEVCIEGSQMLATALLYSGSMNDALQVIQDAENYDMPEFNINISSLHGIIALRQGERETAQEAFTKSIAQADDILAKTPDYYSALDAKGLAICGLAICDLRLKKDVTGLIQNGIETFRKARKIAPHAGVVKSVLRLFDELVKCEGGKILKDVRNAVEGV